MNVEVSLLSKLVQTGQIDKAIARGIEHDHFEDEAVASIYEILIKHVRVYKTPPSFDAVKQYIADKERQEKRKLNFAFQVSSDSVDYLLDKFIGLIKYRATTEAVRDLARRTDDVENWENLDLDALEIARHLAMVVPSSQVGRLSDVQKRIEDYERRKEQVIHGESKLAFLLSMF